MTDTVDRDKVASMIKEIESKTDVEIVPCLVDWSDNHPVARHRLALVAGLLFYATCLIINNFTEHELPTIAALFLGYGVGLLLSRLPSLRRLMISTAELDEESRQRAIEVYFHEGIHRTPKRLGLLIYIAWREHRIHLLADDGLNAKIGKEHWERIVATFVHELKKGAVEKALNGLIGACGDLAVTHFPKTHGDTNDLSDHLR